MAVRSYTATLLMATACQAVLELDTPPMGWEDFDSQVSAAYNESFIRGQALAQARQLLPSGYDQFVIGGWSVGGLLSNGSAGIPDPNQTHQWTNLDEYGRPAPDGQRLPSSVVGGGAGDCICDGRNCTAPTSSACTDPVCICKAGTRSLRPLAGWLNDNGLRLGLWTWRGVHRAAAVRRLRVKGTPYTIDEIVDRNADGTPCLSGRCAGACPWLPTLGINASHPGAQAYYDSLYDLFINEWNVEFVKADCEDSGRPAETLLQANAVKKQPLIPGPVKGSDKPRGLALSLSPGVYGPAVTGDAGGGFLAAHQAATMYRITTDFWGSQGAVFGGLAGGGGSIARASLHANASLIGANGTFPDLDMIPLGMVRCVNDSTQACRCDNCEGTGMAYTMVALWSMARSPLLVGGSLPLDETSVSLLTNEDMLYVHAAARNQTVMAYYQANTSCTPRTAPKCDWMAHGWTKWSADLALPPGPTTGVAGRATDSSSTWPRRRIGTAATAANPPLKAVLIVNVGHPRNTYPLPPTGPSGRLTHTSWASLGLPAVEGSGGDGGAGSSVGVEYTARDVFSQQLLPSDATGFTANVTGYNATLVLVQSA